MGYIYVILFLLVGIGIVVGGLIASALLSRALPTTVKGEPYECGEVSIGAAWLQFNVGYYLFALLFLIFDVEAAFIYPCALMIKSVGLVAFIELTIFVAVLFLGLIWAWRKGVLEWA